MKNNINKLIVLLVLTLTSFSSKAQVIDSTVIGFNISDPLFCNTELLINYIDTIQHFLKDKEGNILDTKTIIYNSSSVITSNTNTAPSSLIIWSGDISESFIYFKIVVNKALYKTMYLTTTVSYRCNNRQYVNEFTNVFNVNQDVSYLNSRTSYKEKMLNGDSVNIVCDSLVNSEGVVNVTCDTTMILLDIVKSFDLLRQSSSSSFEDEITVLDFNKVSTRFGSTHKTIGGTFYKASEGVENFGTVIVANDGTVWRRQIESDRVEYDFFEINNIDIISDADRINKALSLYDNVNISSRTKKEIILKESIKIVNKKKLNIDANLKVTDVLAVPILNDALLNSTTITVADGDLFQVGDRLLVSDDDSPLQGGTLQTRRIGSDVEILSISNNILTVTPLQEDYTVAANAYAGIGISAILLNNADSTEITGSGTIDGNWINQIDVEPIKFIGEESFKTGCGIAIIDSDYVTVTGLNIKNAALHNLGVKESSYLTAANLKLYDAHDKNLVCFGADAIGWDVENIYMRGALFEDGLSLYLGPSNSSFSKIRIDSMPRYGIWSNISSVNNTYSDIVINNSLIAISNGAENNNWDNIIINGGRKSKIGVLVENVRNDLTKNVKFNVLTIDAKNAPLMTLGVTINNSNDVIVDNFSVINMADGFAIRVGDSNGVIYSNGFIDNVDAALKVTTLSDSVLISSVIVKNQDVISTLDHSNTTFRMCKGLRVDDSFDDVYVKGRVGVNTTTPFAGVHVQNDNIYAIGGTNRTLAFGLDLSTQYGALRYSTSNSIDILNAAFSSNTGILRVGNNGKIGILRQPNDAILEIGSNGNESALSIVGQSASANIFSTYYTSPVLRGFKLLNENSDILMSFNNSTNNIAVGKETTNYKLDIAGTLNVDGFIKISITYPLDGTGVPNSSFFKGIDGNPYWKSDAGIVTSLF